MNQSVFKSLKMVLFCASVLLLSGCIHKIVTVPVGIAYKTTKVAVKGTAMVVGAVIPDGDDDEQEDKQQKK